ncbi:amino acid ABC transporter permease [Paracidovorax cattleyae]|uniref:Amino acid ABC transporter membrane protein 2, PAAT family n=1 Tax=Paracidovorax cattleyae TaxID=80868 RepID=A0A1H0MDK5_9BURK|nr:amino acid ABC transporter permease [Paracidovorax cattleyae]MBF9264080.1 amino acid ABC transporter permease [Paracidovorax cattleyae]SDO78395.1 amino acid ABC transporter membrane protein 2, PAAT family [Paracidovorax cattleyae]
MDVAFLNLNYLLRATVVTLEIAAATVVFSFLLGTLLGVFAALGGPVVRAVLAVYVYIVRGVPVLVLIFIAFFGLPRLGIDAPNYVAATIALVIYFAAFVADIVRGSIAAVPKTTVEAGMAIGLRKHQILLQVQLPLGMRLALPPLVTTASIAVKSTSYASIVGVWELTYASREVVERTLAAFEIFFAVMLIYFCICYPISLGASYLQRRFQTS